MSDHILWETINEQKQKIAELENELRYQEQTKRIAEKAVVDLTNENSELKKQLEKIKSIIDEDEKIKCVSSPISLSEKSMKILREKRNERK